MGRGLHHVLLCALLQHASVGPREQVQPPLPPPRRRFFWRGERPLGSGGIRSLPGPAPAMPLPPVTPADLLLINDCIT